LPKIKPNIEFSINVKVAERSEANLACDWYLVECVCGIQYIVRICNCPDGMNCIGIEANRLCNEACSEEQPEEPVV
jgi:hypothetical protein